MTDPVEKANRYEELLSTALREAELTPPADTPLGEAGTTFTTMAESYLEDGRHFRADDDPVNAVAAFAYGHAWLDAGARLGLFDVPTDDTLFTV